MKINCEVFYILILNEMMFNRANKKSLIIIIQFNMIGLLRLFTNNFASKKLGIAETAKVIQEKIMSIAQVVIFD